MILSCLNNIQLKNNVLLHSDHTVCYDVTNFSVYQTIFNECKKNLLHQEIKFDNIATKKKEKDDENITSVNFLVNHLLNIFNKKNIKSSFDIQNNTNIKKQQTQSDQNLKLTSYSTLKHKDKINIKENDKTTKIFKNNDILNNSTNIKNKCFLFYNYNVINCFKKLYSKSNFNEINNLKIVKNKKNFINTSKNFICFKNDLHNKSNVLVSKNIYKNQHAISEVNSFKKIDENYFFPLNKKSILVVNNKNNLQWKKAISQQVLLSISNKENKAEIRLKPVLLGAIYVEIKIKDNQAQLKFLSDYTEVKNFLNNCIPFLRDSLIKNGIFLKQVNISSSFNVKKNKNLSILKYIPRTSNVMKKFQKNLTHKKFVDMYI